MEGKHKLRLQCSRAPPQNAETKAKRRESLGTWLRAASRRAPRLIPGRRIRRRGDACASIRAHNSGWFPFSASVPGRSWTGLTAPTSSACPSSSLRAVQEASRRSLSSPKPGMWSGWSARRAPNIFLWRGRGVLIPTRHTESMPGPTGSTSGLAGSMPVPACAKGSCRALRRCWQVGCSRQATTLAALRTTLASSLVATGMYCQTTAFCGLSLRRRRWATLFIHKCPRALRGKLYPNAAIFA